MREGHSEIVTLLLEYGAAKDHKNLEGLTPTQLADKKKKKEIVTALNAPSAPRQPSRGPEGAVSPVPFSESENDDYAAAAKVLAGAQQSVLRVPHMGSGGGDALEEDLEAQAQVALSQLDLVDDVDS